MSLIHKTAIIDDGATIHETAEIGPYVIIGSGVKIGAGTTIGAHSVIDGDTTIGQNCRIFPGVAIGFEPQDLRFKGEATGVIIGDRCIFREYVTIHRATGDGVTTIGNDCYFMNYAHVAHNCTVGNGVILANGTQLAGHVSIGDLTITSGHCVFHQFVRVGRSCMMSGLSGARLDLPPFTMIDGRPAFVRGINVIGLRRQGVGQKVRSAIKEAYRLLYRSGINKSDALSKIEEQIEPYPEIQEIINFFRESKRGVAAFLDESEEVTDEAPVEIS